METVFELLEARCGDKNYHLKSLHYIDEVDLDIYREISSELSLGSIKTLLISTNWREHLVAYMLILSCNIDELLPELKKCLEQNSFVAPQLVCAIAVLGGRSEGKYLLDFMNSATVDSKTYGALLAALPYCFINNIDINYSNIDLSEFQIGLSIADEHLRCWKCSQIKP